MLRASPVVNINFPSTVRLNVSIRVEIFNGKNEIALKLDKRISNALRCCASSLQRAQHAELPKKCFVGKMKKKKQNVDYISADDLCSTLSLCGMRSRTTANSRKILIDSSKAKGAYKIINCIDLYFSVNIIYGN